MSKKLEANGLWESSRIILPEHREALLRWRKERNRRERPVIDDQAREEFARLIGESAETGRVITVNVYDPYDSIEITGYVNVLDTYAQRFRFVHDGGRVRTWIAFEDVIDVKKG